MAKKRKRAKSMHGEPGRKRGKRRSFMHGGKGFSGRNIQNMALDVLGIGAGVIGSAYIGQMLPIKDNRLKAAVPAIGGIALAGMVKQPMLRHLGYGLAVAGIVSLARQFVPAIPALAGVDEMEAQLQLLGEEVIEGEPYALGYQSFDGQEANGIDPSEAIDGQADDLFGVSSNFDGEPYTLGEDEPFFTPAST